MRIQEPARLGKLASVILAATMTITSASAASKLDKLIAQKAATVERLHFKANKALVTAAQDKTFGLYFHADHQMRNQIKPRIDQISLSVQSRFHVEEMCLINPEGAELSRIVGREIADDLADDETGAIFFAPGFATPVRKVHISPIYMSVDANKWVTAYVTPVVVEGNKKAILHYEHTLRSFQDALNKRMERENGAVLVAIDADGYIVSDSRKAIAIDKKGDAEDRADYFDRFDLDGMNLSAVRNASGGSADKGAGTVKAGGKTYSVAYQTVEDWTILAFRAEKPDA